MRRLDLVAVVALVVLTLAWALFPPAGRPQDIDLQVEVRPLPVRQPGWGQELEATVRWQWRRRPLWPLGRWHNCVAFSYDWARWTQLLEGAGISDGVQAVQVQFREPSSGQCMLIGDAESGEWKTTFVSRDAPAGERATPAFPLRVQFIHLADGRSGEVPLGWVHSFTLREQ